MDNKASGIKIIPTDLILNDDLSVYHLNLLQQDIADTIILLGDRDRVPLVSAFFDKIEVKKEKRNSLPIPAHIKEKDFLPFQQVLAPTMWRLL